jgi:non-heme chloroperoxidase
MNDHADIELEIISRKPAAKAARIHPTPLLFIHGAYTGAWCWEEYFLPWFAARGWSAHAVSLSGHGKSPGHGFLDTLSIDDYVADVAKVIALLPSPPVLIGHSMGGIVTQKYLERTSLPAAVLLASVPPQGLAGSAIGMLLSAPHVLADLNRLMGGGEVQADSLREALFHQPIEPERLLRYWTLSQPESHRAIWDMTLFGLPHPSRMHTLPLLVLGAERDRLIPPVLVEMTASTFGVDAEIFPGLGHAMMLEAEWESVARRIDDWLGAQGL